MPKAFELPLHASNHCRHYSYERGKNWLDGGPRCARNLDLTVPGSSGCCMPEPRGPCTLREEYTDAERAAWEAARSAGMGRLANAVLAVPHPIPMRTGGTMECPNCEGVLHYGRWRGGAEIQCETPNCCGAHFNIKGDTPWPAP